MKRVKLDHTEMEKEVQNQSSEEDQTLANTVLKEKCIAEGIKQGFLFYAAEKGDFKSLSKFLKSGKYEANLEQFDCLQYRNSSMTPLHVAAEYGNIECAKILLEYGIDVNSQDDKQCTPLHLAAKNGRFHCLKLLLEAGADVSTHTGLQVKRTVLNYNPRNTALHLAASFNHVDCVRELIRFGADCSATDIFGNTSLLIAAACGFNECVLAHLSNSRDRAFLFIQNFSTLETPLHLAIGNGMLDCVKELVRLGSNLNIVDVQGTFPLQLACFYEKNNFEVSEEILRILILDSENIDMNTVLSPSFFSIHSVKMKALLIGYAVHKGEYKVALHRLLQNELCSSYFPNMLEYIVHSIPQLPLLQTFNLYPELYPEASKIWENSIVYGDVEFELIQRRGNMYVKVYHVSDDILSDTLSVEDADSNPSLVDIIPLRQPYLNVVYNYVTESSKRVVIRSPISLDTVPHWKIVDHLWYQKVAINPRTLQHHCRFAIRKWMSPGNFRFINNLPLPQRLKSYLLFKCDEKGIKT